MYSKRNSNSSAFTLTQNSSNLNKINSTLKHCHVNLFISHPSICFQERLQLSLTQAFVIGLTQCPHCFLTSSLRRWVDTCNRYELPLTVDLLAKKEDIIQRLYEYNYEINFSSWDIFGDYYVQTFLEFAKTIGLKL